MRPFLLLSAVVVFAILATCTANAESDQTKTVKLELPDFVHQLDIGHKNDGTARLLRVHQQNEEFEAARSILNIDDLSARNTKAMEIYKAWASKYQYRHTVSSYLKIGEKEKYSSIWYGYLAYLDNTFTHL
ncbi:RxLR effector protein [Phytophthora megakarya]|uniref:RxLR effector protein n=1 Tax=Phytophthora megakarya TaxID=4795 RepID=A0A225WNP5_9STRA|nr:RxLR effector protein [Phytophthora megakarya]